MKAVGDYILIKVLGKGSFGETYLTQKKNDPTFLATKVLERKKMDRDSTKKYLDNEIKILRELNHPHICRFYDILATNSNYYLIMEYCNGGDLTKNLERYKKTYGETFNIEIVQYLMKQIIDAFTYIHSLNIIHRDIKLDNILLSFETEADKQNLNILASSIKVIDFGLSTKLDYTNLAHTVLGSPINMDPLILAKFDKAGGYKMLEGYNDKADIWSLGTVFYQLLTGEVLFHANTMQELMRKVEEGNYVIPFNKNFSKEAVSFLNCMLQYKPEDRLSITELAQHDFIVKNVNEFTQADITQIFNRVGTKGLLINVKKNETIKKIFNTDERNQIIPNHNRLSTEAGFSDYGNIYGINSNVNRRRSSGGFNGNKIIQIPKLTPVKNNRFAEGYISPGRNHDIKYEINKMDKEINGNQNQEIKFIDVLKKEIKEQQNKETEKRKNWDKGRNEVERYIKGLLGEYKAAIDYFNKNGLKLQEQDANIKYLELQTIYKNFEKGYSIYYESLPKPITQEYIYNCSIEKRNSNFQIIISKYKEDKKELEDNIKKEILNYQKLDNKEFALIKDKVMSKLNSDKAKIDKLKKIIKALEERYNNKWTPAPEFIEDFEMDSIEKISLENCYYKLVIHIGKINNTDSNLVLKFSLNVNEAKNFDDEVKLLKSGDFDKDITWDLSQNEYNNISNYIILVKFYSNKLYQGSTKLNISKLANEKDLNLYCPINLPRQSMQTMINFNFKIIIPGNNKQIKNGLKKIIKVKKAYPPFEGKSPDTSEIPSMYAQMK